MHTSGSTGKPKGVCVTHRGIVRLVANTNYVDIRSEDVFLQLAPLSFDASTFEIWGCLLNGARLVIFPPLTPSLEELGQALEKYGVTILWLTSTLFHQMVDYQLPNLKSVRQLLAGGDVLSVPHVLKVIREFNGCRLINGYGPTENTTFSCTYSIERPEQIGASVPIGRPIANTQVYVFDRYLTLVPIGVPGELYIGGDGLALGYFNQPELTSQKFIPSPFSHDHGKRLYKTGDLVRYMADGNLEFIGRIDHQVKIRGFRVEPGEIEATLRQHAAVKECVVLASEDTQGNKRLVAYVVPTQLNAHASADAEESLSKTESHSTLISQWQMVFDNSLNDQKEIEDPALNLAGWNSSYTGLPIPTEEMSEQVEHTVDRIRRLQAQRVLEIGCGTGLLLLRIAPACARYCGTDFSPAMLDYVRKQVKASGLSHIELLQRAADDFTAWDARAFDLVVLNSVVQYFPGIDYLVRVLEGATRLVSPSGLIFVGDVRSLPLLETFYTAVEMYRARSSLSARELQESVRGRLSREQELVIDPEFFTDLKEYLPQISRVEIQLKRGHHHNELTQFRYDVVLQVGGEGCEQLTSWKEWEEIGNLEGLRQLLKQQEPAVLGVRGIPNARLEAAVKASELLTMHDCQLTVAELHDGIKGADEAGVDPESFWALGDERSYEVSVTWSTSGAKGSYDVVFTRRITDKPLNVFDYSLARGRQLKPWDSYANDPMKMATARNLASSLRDFLREHLPEFLIPSAFIVLESLPLNKNGKVDRAALLPPDPLMREREATYVAPSNPIEEALANLWAKFLGLMRVGTQDNFFDLGGHSLIATQLVSRIRDIFHVELPLQNLFESPTVAGLAEAIAKRKGELNEETIPIVRQSQQQTSIDMSQLSDEEVDLMLRDMLPGGLTR
jgi:acyl-CoA synthetase (AMP-forming)/AMP-acid ligase II/ubiquinone/menaquinone biosynthesis C-methylase UbiE/acyl carrier protein